MVLAAVGCLILLAALIGDVSAQQRRQRATPVPVPQPQVPARPAAPGVPVPPDAATALPRETVQADVSTRRVAVTSTFSGTEIVVFGAIDNSRQASPEAGIYDVVVVVVGTLTRLEARKKNRVLGVWLNTESMSFQSVPNYYSIVSTRPLDEVASEEVLKSQEIGFDYVPMTLGKGEQGRSAAEVRTFREAIVRLKRKEKLYGQDEYGVAFIGRSLFRASVDVPANVVVGPFDTRVFLFRNRELIHQYRARLDLEREGLEDALHSFAFRYPLTYGIATVLLAVGAGLLASAVFRKGAH
jgi:uncharacterized protein (TIGR02186 family)